MIEQFDVFLSSNNFYRMLGLCGFATYVLMYVLLTFNFVDSEHRTYYAGNTLAAALTLCSVLADYNLTTVLISVFWIGIGTTAIVLRSGKNKSRRDEPTRAAVNV